MRCVFAADRAQFAAVPNNFPKALLWAPDGTCLLSLTADNVFRVLEAESSGSGGVGALSATLRVAAGEDAYQCAWSPLMRSASPASCVFAFTSRDHPVRLVDAYVGRTVGSFVNLDSSENFCASVGLGFACDGAQLFAGVRDAVRAFDVSRPGRDCRERRFARRARVGIVSTVLGVPSSPQCAWGGSYGGAVVLVDFRDGAAASASAPAAAGGGVTALACDAAGGMLAVGCRQRPRVAVYDTRNLAVRLAEFERAGDTNQRLPLAVDAQRGVVHAGAADGSVARFCLRTLASVGAPSQRCADDCIGALSVLPEQGESGGGGGELLALGVGSRRFLLSDRADGPRDDDSALLVGPGIYVVRAGDLPTA